MILKPDGKVNLLYQHARFNSLKFNKIHNFMQDLTIIFLTASQTPDSFAEYHRKILLEAAGDYPIICVSRKPMDFGVMNLLDTEPKCLSNIYRQMLRAAKLATTEYIATAEDDTFYSKEHFNFYRPEKDTFAYNQSRWALFTWLPMYSWRNRKSNCSLIAPRELLIEALEERFAKYPNGTPEEKTGELGRWRVEKKLNLTLRKSVEMYSDVPIIQFNHDNASEAGQRRHRKRLGSLKAFDIPFWGPAKDLIKLYK